MISRKCWLDYLQNILVKKGEVRMNNMGKVAVVIGLIVLVGMVLTLKSRKNASQQADRSSSSPEKQTSVSIDEKGTRTYSPSVLPRLVDLGAGKCIPCKMMAPILEELKKEYEGKLEVVFLDVWEHPEAGEPYDIKMIPTQIFIAPSGKEQFRHEGFFSKEDILAKWKELGFDFSADEIEFSRLEPAVVDSRDRDKICYMCDGDINSRTLVTVKTEKGDVNLCCPHCYFITYTSLLEKEDIDQKVSVTGGESNKEVSATEAVYLYSMDAKGRPVIRAFVTRADAENEQKKCSGSILDWEALKSKELAQRCGFCDRAVYPEDSAKVIVEGGMQTWGCCPMCALGVAARTGKDIEVLQKDVLTGEMVHVKTTGGSISLLEPETAVAWAGKKKTEDGKLASAGCFKQAFFVNEDNLKKWVQENPTATGMMISIHSALAAKMKLSPEQIQKACKIGECAPK
jgi:thioredoxin 1